MLRITQPLEAAPPTPGPEECEEEEEEEFLRRDELQDNLGAQATSSSLWAFKRFGLLAPADRDAELRAERLEGATSLGSRRQLRLLGHPSEELLQWYLTLRRSDAMGTFPSSFHCPSQFSRFQSCQSAATQFAIPKRIEEVKTIRDLKASLWFPSSQRACKIPRRFGLHRATSEPPKHFRDYKALGFSLQYKAFRDVKALRNRKTLQGPRMAARP